MEGKLIWFVSQNGRGSFFGVFGKEKGKRLDECLARCLVAKLINCCKFSWEEQAIHNILSIYLTPCIWNLLEQHVA